MSYFYIKASVHTQESLKLRFLILIENWDLLFFCQSSTEVQKTADSKKVKHMEGIGINILFVEAPTP